VVYKGYVDDPRNTDNSWMVTVVQNIHDENGDSFGSFKLHAGDDAKGVRWTDIDSQLKLYASHSSFVHMVAEHHKAHW
jgi:ADP-ribose pyrophosphatase